MPAGHGPDPAGKAASPADEDWRASPSHRGRRRLGVGPGGRPHHRTPPPSPGSHGAPVGGSPVTTPFARLSLSLPPSRPVLTSLRSTGLQVRSAVSAAASSPLSAGPRRWHRRGVACSDSGLREGTAMSQHPIHLPGPRHTAPRPPGLFESRIAQIARRQKAAIRVESRGAQQNPESPNMLIHTPAVQWEFVMPYTF